MATMKPRFQQNAFHAICIKILFYSVKAAKNIILNGEGDHYG